MYIFLSGATIITDGSLGSGDKYSFIDSTTCKGVETTLADCILSVQDNCLPKCPNNIAIRCYSKMQ